MPAVLLGLYIVEFVVLSFGPYDRAVWFAENLTVWILVGILVALWWRGVRFSSLAYLMMAVLIFLHTIGGHFTFELVPFDWVTETFGFQRNHFDRIAHFSVGFWAYPIAEWLATRRLVGNRFLLFTYPLLVIMSMAALYEMIEWIYAAAADPEAGASFLGSQGDPWDAQRDMLADTLGALFAMALFFGTGKGRIFPSKGDRP